MKIAVYGLPSSGKTTLINNIPDVTVINGRQELERLSSGQFSSMTETDKKMIRIRYTEYLASLKDSVIVSDGHDSFFDNVVFTEQDGDVYDVIFYLYCRPEEVLKRCSISEKNQKYSNLSVETIGQWQDFEIESLRMECHKRDKDFYVISDNNQKTSFYEFFNKVINGYSDVQYAKTIAKRIADLSTVKEIYLVDGDKTIIEQDSFRFCYDGKTVVFDGDFYTGYQSYLFNEEIRAISSVPESVKDIKLNSDVWNMISEKNYVVISSGLTVVWDSLKAIWGFKEVIANPLISADVKYYVVKFLKQTGFRVVALGDSKNDYYMLKEADTGYLKIGKRLSRSLKNTDVSGIQMLSYKEPYVLFEDASEDDLFDISVCKSNSGVNGNRLAAAHMRLGQRLGQVLASKYPSRNTAVLVLDRGGRFFGDGVYSSFGGVFYPYNPACEKIPEMIHERIVIVDSVINSGKSVLKLIADLKEAKPNRDIVVVSNVVQKEALKLFSEYMLLTVRVSENSFVGKRQAVQKGKSGPDTADRLFNIIERSF